MSTTTDILDTTIPEPAWVLDPTYDSELNPELTHSRASAARMVSDEGKYVSRASGVERVSYGFDGDPGLLVEAAGRTNHQPYSSEIQVVNGNWNSGEVSSTSVSSIIDGENAFEITADTGDGGVRGPLAGPATASSEVVHGIVEESSAAQVRFGLGNLGDFYWLLYDFEQDSIIGTNPSPSGIEDAHKRVITQNGPNGGRLVQLILRYDASKDGYDGNNRQTKFEADAETNGNASIWHHAQIEEAPNASSPIVTQGSPVTRAGDEYSIDITTADWWNELEGTLITTVVPHFFQSKSSGKRGFISQGNFGQRYGSFKTEPDGLRIVSFDRSGNSGKVGKEDGFQYFTPVTFGISFTRQEAIISATQNGNVRSATYVTDGTLPVAVSPLDLGASDNVSIKNLSYIPRALPESTLNAITS